MTPKLVDFLLLQNYIIAHMPMNMVLKELCSRVYICTNS